MKLNSVRIKSYVLTYKIYGYDGIKEGEIIVKGNGFYSALNNGMIEAGKSCKQGEIIEPIKLINAVSGKELPQKYFRR